MLIYALGHLIPPQPVRGGDCCRRPHQTPPVEGQEKGYLNVVSNAGQVLKYFDTQISKELQVFEADDIAGFDCVLALLALAFADGLFQDLSSYEAIPYVDKEDIIRSKGFLSLQQKDHMEKVFVLRQIGMDGSHPLQFAAGSNC